MSNILRYFAEFNGYIMGSDFWTIPFWAYVVYPEIGETPGTKNAGLEATENAL